MVMLMVMTHCEDNNNHDDIILVLGSFFPLLLFEVPHHLFHFHHDG
jgi:hypothetical protein